MVLFAHERHLSASAERSERHRNDSPPRLLSNSLKMAELKTKPTATSVSAFVSAVEDEQMRRDARKLLALMKQVTRKRPRMWGTSIVGFGSYHYKYKSGREGDWPVTGFSPRKNALTIYIMPGFTRYRPLLKKLGKYTTGKSCLYLKKLEDVDEKVLRQLVTRSVTDMKKLYECT